MPRRLIWTILCLWVACVSQSAGCYTDAAADRVDQGFDAAGRRTSLSAQLTGNNTFGRSRAFGYRADGLLLQEAVDGNNYAFAYDGGGRLLSRTNGTRAETVTGRDLDGNVEASGMISPVARR